MALNLLQVTGDDELSHFRRAVHSYVFSIALLFPPPAGGIMNVKASTILNAAKTIASIKLFDYRIFDLEPAWRLSEQNVNGIKIPRRYLQSKIAFKDAIVTYIFREYLFNPKRGLSHLLDVINFEGIEDQIERRTEEMIAMADVINIYMLCGPEIKRRSRHNGFDIVTELYLSSTNSESGDRTLSNNWRCMKSAAIFQYLFRHQARELALFTPPKINSGTFAKEILSMANFKSVSDLISAHDYVSFKLNSDFNLDLPVITAPPPDLNIFLDQEYRGQLLRLLK